MTKEVLSSYIDACELLRETQADLERLQQEHKIVDTDIVKGSNPNFPYEPRTFHIEGVSYSEYIKPDEIKKIQRLLKERRENARKQRMEVEAWVNTAPLRIQRIVRMKYFEGLTWDTVSKRMGYTSPYAALVTLKRYLEEE